jgi:hypothetical protein
LTWLSFVNVTEVTNAEPNDWWSVSMTSVNAPRRRSGGSRAGRRYGAHGRSKSRRRPRRPRVIGGEVVTQRVDDGLRPFFDGAHRRIAAHQAELAEVLAEVFTTEPPLNAAVNIGIKVARRLGSTVDVKGDEIQRQKLSPGFKWWNTPWGKGILRPECFILLGPWPPRKLPFRPS